MKRVTKYRAIIVSQTGGAGFRIGNLKMTWITRKIKTKQKTSIVKTRGSSKF
jgi:hypothetical protein